MNIATMVLWFKMVIGWRVRLERAVKRALMPFADDHLPPIEAFVSRDVMPKATSESAALRELQLELDDLVRGFIVLHCPTQPHQSPYTRVTLLDTVSGVVAVRSDLMDENGVMSMTDRRLPIRAVLSSGFGQSLIVECGEELIIGGPHAPSGVHRTEDPTLSARHATIHLDTQRCTVTDLGSLNHTYVNGRDIGRKATELQDGDELRLGDLRFGFSWTDADRQNNSGRRSGHSPRGGV